MAIRPDWNIGKINLVAGSAEFVTLNAMLNMSAVEPGDVIITPSGHILVIKEITGANSGTLMLPCPAGAAGTELPLRIRFQPDGSRLAGALRSASALLSGGNVEALAGLVGQDGKIPIFTGAGTMGLVDASHFEADLSGVNESIDLLFDELNDAEEAINNRVRFDDDQDLNASQQQQARQNISAFQQPTGTVNQFIRGNGTLQSIVGTVAQSGGSIVQRGSNANGEFVRIADGTQICWKYVQLITLVSEARAEAATSFYFGQVVWQYPAAFASTDIVFGAEATGWSNETGSGEIIIALTTSSRFSDNGSAYQRFWSFQQFKSLEHVKHVAIGRWF